MAARLRVVTLAAVLAAPLAAEHARAEAPAPKAGIVPTGLATVAAATGPDLKSGALDIVIAIS